MFSLTFIIHRHSVVEIYWRECLALADRGPEDLGLRVGLGRDAEQGEGLAELRRAGDHVALLERLED